MARLYYARVLETMPDLTSKFVIVTDLIYGFRSYKWRDVYIREFNALAMVPPYASCQVNSHCMVCKRNDFLDHRYRDITRHCKEYMPKYAIKCWTSEATFQGYGLADRCAPLVRVPSKVDYEMRGGYLVPVFGRKERA